jgi:hypothetical protein
MKRLLLSFSLVVVSYGYCHAVGEDFGDVNQPNSYSSPVVNTSSNTKAVTVDTFISSRTTQLHTVSINQAGTGSTLEIWDTRGSTSSITSKKIATIDTTAKACFHYDVVLATGMKINNQGTPPADVTLSYRYK